MTFCDLEGRLCCLKPLWLQYLWKCSIYWLRYVYIWIGKCTWLVVLTVLLKVKDFSRSQAVTYAVNVVISWKRCQIELLSLQTTNRKWCRQFWWLWVTFVVIYLLQTFYNAIFICLCSSWQHFYRQCITWSLR